MRILFLLLTCCYLPLFSFGKVNDHQTAVYLLVEDNPSKAITVRWISSAQKVSDTLFFKKEGTICWKKRTGIHHPLPQGFNNWLVHSLKLNHLESDTTYLFRIEGDERIYQFKTLPKKLEGHTVRFVVGGDVYHDDLENMVPTHQMAAKQNPSFALLGGDIAYAADKNKVEKEKIDRWLEFFSAWEQYMVTPEGNMVPILAAIGNEDTEGRYNQSPKNAPFFYALLTSGTSFGAFDFTDDISVIVLDSNHTHSPRSQEFFLDGALSKRRHKLHKFALYHIPAFPGYRPYNNKASPLIRNIFVPLFEKWGVNAAFEHHDHTYKRTHPILKEKVHPKGVLYLGDGGWGVKEPRPPKIVSERWYLAKTAKERHFILVTLNKNERRFDAINFKGQIFDTITQKVHHE